MVDVSIKVDTSGFNKAFSEYVKFNKRSMSEIVNTKALFIARGAVALTGASSKEQISDDLLKGSKVMPSAPVAAIIINTNRGKAGQPGLNGQRMATEVNKFVRMKQATRNFLRSGWIPAIKKLNPFVTSKKGAPKMPSGVRSKGKDKGGAITAPREGTWNATATIWNAVFGNNKTKGKATQLIQEGLQKSVDKETASMNQYVSNKLEEGITKFNAS